MAVLYITEYNALAAVPLGFAPVGKEPPLATQTVAITGSAAESSAFNAQTKFIRVHTDIICSIDIGPAPSATATSPRMTADQTEYFGVDGGDEISVITNT